MHLNVARVTQAVRVAMQKEGVKGLWAESLANPGGIVTDIRAMADICNEVIPIMIDFLCFTRHVTLNLE